MAGMHSSPPCPPLPKLPLTHCAGGFPLILALGPTWPPSTHPSSQNRGAGRSVVVQDTHTDTHAQSDPHLAVFADHFTGQSPYPSLQGHCEPALSWERSFIHREKLFLCPLSFSLSLLDDGWRKGSPHTDTVYVWRWGSYLEYEEALGLQSRTQKEGKDKCHHFNTPATSLSHTQLCF